MDCAKTYVIVESQNSFNEKLVGLWVIVGFVVVVGGTVGVALLIMILCLCIDQKK